VGSSPIVSTTAPVLVRADTGLSADLLSKSRFEATGHARATSSPSAGGDERPGGAAVVIVRPGVIVRLVVVMGGQRGFERSRDPGVRLGRGVLPVDDRHLHRVVAHSRHQVPWLTPLRAASVFPVCRRSWTCSPVRPRPATAASSILNNSQDCSTFVSYWTCELAWHQAMSLASLGERSAALELFHQAWTLRSRNAHRARYNDLVHVLEAQVAVEAWSDAEASLIAVIADAPEINSSRTTSLLRRVSNEIMQAASTSPSTLTDSAREGWRWRPPNDGRHLAPPRRCGRVSP